MHDPDAVAATTLPYVPIGHDEQPPRPAVALNLPCSHCKQLCADEPEYPLSQEHASM